MSVFEKFNQLPYSYNQGKNNAAQIQNIKILATLFLLAEGSVLFFQ